MTGALHAPQQELHPLRFEPGSNTPVEVCLENSRVNVGRVLPWLELHGEKDRPLVIVAGGPSLKKSWQWIASHHGDVMALNNSYGFLLDKGIEPEYFMMLDARPENVEFLSRISTHTKHYIASQCDPEVFDTLDIAEAKTVLYLTTIDGIDEIVEGMPGPHHKVAGPVGTVGIKALALAYALGYKEIHLYGYDSSYEGDQHHAFPQALNDDAKTLTVTLNGIEYLTTAAMAHQTTEFCSLATGMGHMGIEIFLHCEGLLPAMVAYSNARGQIPIEDREREKYEKIWTFKEYRKHSPGLRGVRRAVREMGMRPGKSVIDFGCGSGAGAQCLKDLGFETLGIDIAANCLNDDIDIPFLQACLWDQPDVSADYGFCTDVMEHIPTDKVQEVLAQISQRVMCCFFSIATRDDSMGALIGQKLHLTIMNEAMWKKALLEWFSVVQISDTREGESDFVCFGSIN